MLNETVVAAITGTRAFGRVCGVCGLCCRLLPVPDVDKKANQKCRHFSRSSGGCRIYTDRPYACYLWSCHWLVNPEFEKMKRPDKAHYVVDILPEYITTTENGGNARKWPC